MRLPSAKSVVYGFPAAPLAVTVVCFDEQTQLLGEIWSQGLEISLEFVLAVRSLWVSNPLFG